MGERIGPMEAPLEDTCNLEVASVIELLISSVVATAESTSVAASAVPAPAASVEDVKASLELMLKPFLAPHVIVSPDRLNSPGMFTNPGCDLLGRHLRVEMVRFTPSSMGTDHVLLSAFSEFKLVYDRLQQGTTLVGTRHERVGVLNLFIYEVVVPIKPPLPMVIKAVAATELGRVLQKHKNVSLENPMELCKLMPQVADGKFCFTFKLMHLESFWKRHQNELKAYHGRTTLVIGGFFSNAAPISPDGVARASVMGSAVGAPTPGMAASSSGAAASARPRSAAAATSRVPVSGMGLKDISSAVADISTADSDKKEFRTFLKTRLALPLKASQLIMPPVLFRAVLENILQEVEGKSGHAFAFWKYILPIRIEELDNNVYPWSDQLQKTMEVENSSHIRDPNLRTDSKFVLAARDSGSVHKCSQAFPFCENFEDAFVAFAFTSSVATVSGVPAISPSDLVAAALGAYELKSSPPVVPLDAVITEAHYMDAFQHVELFVAKNSDAGLSTRELICRIGAYLNVKRDTTVFGFINPTVFDALMNASANTQALHDAATDFLSEGKDPCEIRRKRKIVNWATLHSISSRIRKPVGDVLSGAAAIGKPGGKSATASGVGGKRKADANPPA